MIFRIALTIGRTNRALSAWNLRELGDKRGRFLRCDFEISRVGSLRSVLIVETLQVIFATSPAYRMSQKWRAFNSDWKER